MPSLVVNLNKKQEFYVSIIKIPLAFFLNFHRILLSTCWNHVHWYVQFHLYILMIFGANFGMTWTLSYLHSSPHIWPYYHNLRIFTFMTLSTIMHLHDLLVLFQLNSFSKKWLVDEILLIFIYCFSDSCWFYPLSAISTEKFIHSWVHEFRITGEGWNTNTKIQSLWNNRRGGKVNSRTRYIYVYHTVL